MPLNRFVSIAGLSMVSGSMSTLPVPLRDREVRRLRDLSPQQVRSGVAAWLGWLFDGLDMHLYTLVATAFVAVLLSTGESDPEVGQKASIIQAASLSAGRSAAGSSGGSRIC
jgi:hypothetical protein